ncbi:MAG: prepilin-type N-terminal cleavage/methylation domain-containing protein [Candidatus Riflebacteria bacterium]|nr:prepilin-type N-terminal cleavage/methylation domain-containing protein [Candidatus Riflebacteria bacterium]
MYMRNGFTLIEVIISTLIISLISLVLVMVYRGNLSAMKWGQKHIEFNQKIQLAMKQIFTDIKRINPIVVTDAQENLWFKGEKIGDLFPNMVEIIDLDKNLQNGGEQIRFTHTSYLKPGERTFIRLFLEGEGPDAGKEDVTSGSLMREVTDANGTKKRSVISNKVSNLHFMANTEDIREVLVRMTITDDRNPGMKEDLAFAVSLDTDLVCVKVIAGKPGN